MSDRPIISVGLAATIFCDRTTFVRTGDRGGLPESAMVSAARDVDGHCPFSLVEGSTGRGNVTLERKMSRRVPGWTFL
jgi:hypothetical protein